MGERGYWELKQRTLRRRTLLAAAAGTAGVALAAACGNQSGKSASQPSASSTANQTPKSGGQLFVSQITTPATLDTQRSTSGNIGNIVGAIHSRLLAFKTGTDPKVTQDHEVEGDLATSVESPDAVTWTIKLRPDAKFQNLAPVSGHAVTSEDVKATFTRAIGKENPGRGALDMIDET